MQGYFSYRLFGEKEELISAYNILKEKSKQDSDINDILLLVNPAEPIFYHQDTFVLALELESSGNINNYGFEFDVMASDLAKLFPNLELYATGYLLDFLPYPIWTSPAGTSKIEESFTAIEVEIDYSELSDNEEIYCPVCQEEFEINLPTDFNIAVVNKEVYIERNCPFCDQPIILTIYN